MAAHENRRFPVNYSSDGLLQLALRKDVILPISTGFPATRYPSHRIGDGPAEDYRGNCAFVHGLALENPRMRLTWGIVTVLLTHFFFGSWILASTSLAGSFIFCWNFLLVAALVVLVVDLLGWAAATARPERVSHLSNSFKENVS
jgi:hypothetical protein